MTLLEAAEMLHHAGVETVHVAPNGAILGVVRSEPYDVETGPPAVSSPGWYQPASEMSPPLREAVEVFMAWRRDQPRPLEVGWFGAKSETVPRECRSDEHEPGVVKWTGTDDSRCPACERISDLHDRIGEANEFR